MKKLKFPGSDSIENYSPALSRIREELSDIGRTVEIFEADQGYLIQEKTGPFPWSNRVLAQDVRYSYVDGTLYPYALFCDIADEQVVSIVEQQHPEYEGVSFKHLGEGITLKQLKRNQNPFCSWSVDILLDFLGFFQ